MISLIVTRVPFIVMSFHVAFHIYCVRALLLMLSPKPPRLLYPTVELRLDFLLLQAPWS